MESFSFVNVSNNVTLVRTPAVLLPCPSLGCRPGTAAGQTPGLHDRSPLRGFLLSSFVARVNRFTSGTRITVGTFFSSFAGPVTFFSFVHPHWPGDARSIRLTAVFHPKPFRYEHSTACPKWRLNMRASYARSMDNLIARVSIHHLSVCYVFAL